MSWKLATYRDLDHNNAVCLEVVVVHGKFSTDGGDSSCSFLGTGQDGLFEGGGSILNDKYSFDYGPLAANVKKVVGRVPGQTPVTAPIFKMPKGSGAPQAFIVVSNARVDQADYTAYDAAGQVVSMGPPGAPGRT